MNDGSKIGHYEIREKIGSGGMGEVYLAHDTKLDRKVAIKFLNEEFSKDADKLGRFIQEAKAASALNHPNILTVYEIGAIDGRNYIATELIDGKTLRNHLSHKESLQLNQILKIGVQVSEALSAAHHAGIIHRDIKPENIMIRRDGYAKVLDFGLAKLSEPGAVATGSEDATRAQVNTTPGMVMGTVSYMSPEQARGNATDPRTDIWSLGVVLYEMLAGKLPFPGETVNHTIVAILEKEPLLLENVPDELQRIVRKSLTKDVDMRYQSAHDLLIDLKNLRRDLDIKGELERSVVPNRETVSEISAENATQFYTADTEATRSGQAAATQNVTTSSSSLEYAVTQAKSHKLVVGVVGLLLFGAISAAAYFVFMSKATSKQINSIAVLPFQNKGGDADTDYLSDGLAESLIFRLSQLPGLKVSPTSSVMRYKGTEMDVSKIARELGVDAVMSGRLVKRGENLNITVELVDTRNNKTLWGEQYERKMSDLLATQREIATAITEKLQLKLSGDDAKGVTKRYTDNNEAYQAYLKGRYYWKQRGGKNLNTGIGYFQEAIRMDPGFALAWSGLADSYVLLPEYTTTSVKEAMPKAKEAAEKAIALDPQLAEAHASVGYVKYAFEWDFAGAEKEFRQAIDLDPKYTTAHQWYGELLCWLHRYDEATAQTRIAVELEPLSALQKYIYAIPFVGMRKYDDADKAYGEALELDRGFGRLQAQMAQNEIAMGRFSEAQKSCEAAIAIDAQLFKYCPAAVYAASADKAKAYALLAEPSNSGLLGVWDRALVYSLAGDKDKAFEALNTLYEERAASVVYISALPGFDNLRGDPRYKELMKKVGFPE